MIVGPSHLMRTRKASVQRAINMMPTPIEGRGEKAAYFLRPVPGLRRFDTDPEPPPQCTPLGTPVVFGNGVHFAIDPVTGYLWTPWNTSIPDKPTGYPDADPALLGHYVLVYNISTGALVDHIKIGDEIVGGMQYIMYRDGAMWIGTGVSPIYHLLGGAGYADTVWPLTKMDAASRSIVLQTLAGMTSSLTRWAALSDDATNIYISSCRGTTPSAGIYSEIDDSLAGGFVTNTHVYANVYVAANNSRVYAGDTRFVDIVAPGNVVTGVDTLGILTNDSSLATGHMLAGKTGTTKVFVGRVFGPAVAIIDTTDGSIATVTTDISPTVLYYSPDSNRLYVDGTLSGTTTRTVLALDGDTFDQVAEYPDRAIGRAERFVQTHYIGCESFVASGGVEGTTKQEIWKLGFPHPA